MPLATVEPGPVASHGRLAGDPASIVDVNTRTRLVPIPGEGAEVDHLACLGRVTVPLAERAQVRDPATRNLISSSTLCLTELAAPLGQVEQGGDVQHHLLGQHGLQFVDQGLPHLVVEHSVRRLGG